MNNYFSTDYSGGPFVFFTVPHWTALAILCAIYAGLYLARDYFKRPQIDLYTRYVLAVLLILQELSLNIWRLAGGAWSVATSLPLHLCGVAVILSAIMLINKNYKLFELCYFWGLGGAIQALLTPDIGAYGYPHFRYFQFFFSHGLIILASLYLVFISGYRPTQRSIWRVFYVTNLYMIFIALFNWLTGANYLFICYKPVDGSLIDFMGPWPWYILSLEVVAVLSFYIYYSPFAFRDGIHWLRFRPDRDS
ncbi:MAG: TIGR02206 family membrane protein [Candidatus Neomarinimicrobiota bacterium]